MSGITCGTRREMKRIESGLSTLDIALLRWRAWAQFSEQVLHQVLQSVHELEGPGVTACKEDKEEIVGYLKEYLV